MIRTAGVLLSAGLLGLTMRLPMAAAFSASGPARQDPALGNTTPTVTSTGEEGEGDILAASLTAEAKAGDQLLGIIYTGTHHSRLVSVDLETAAVVRTYLQLDTHEAFVAMTYDRNHHRIYALTDWRNNLYAIDARTLKIKHLGNLRISAEVGARFNAQSLTYDPGTNRLYTAVQHGFYPDPGPMWTDLAVIDPDTAEISVLGGTDNALIKNLSFNESDRFLYGLAKFSELPDENYSIVRVDPQTGFATLVFTTPYSVLYGFAIKAPASFVTWVNAAGEGHHSAEWNLDGSGYSPRGSTDPGNDYVFATLHQGVAIRKKAYPPKPVPVAFSFEGVVDSVSDPQNVLGGSLVPGARFSGDFSYDASAPFNSHFPNGHPPYGASRHLNGSDYVFEGLTAGVENNYFAYDQSVTDTFGLETHIEHQIKIVWTLKDPTARALPSNDLLPRQFRLEKWPFNEFVVKGLDQEGHTLYTVTGRVDRIRRQRR